MVGVVPGTQSMGVRCLLPGELGADNGTQAHSVGKIAVQRIDSIFKDLRFSRLPRQI